MRLAIAQAEAEALRLQRELVSPELLQLCFIERWNGTLQQFMAGGETKRLDPRLDRVVGPAAVLVTVLGLLLLSALISACNRLISG